MFVKCLVTVCACCAFFVSPIAAQPDTQDVELLKLQLRQLQAQLDQISSEPAKPELVQRVTSVGSQSSMRNKRENTLVMRVYDLSDLFTIAPQYPAQHPDDVDLESRVLFPNALAAQSSESGLGGMGGGLGGGTFNIPSPPPASLPTKGRRQPDPFSSISYANPQDVVTTGTSINLVSLAEVITQTISPEEWEENGGDSRIAILGNSFIVSCYPSMHEKINELFELFRKKWGSLRTIAVQAYWCRASVDQIDDLIGATARADASDPARGVSVIDDQKWKAFLETAQEAGQIAYASAITSQNGQTVHALSGDLTSYVARSTPTIRGDETPVVAYKNETATIHQGAALQVTPLATRGGNFVMLDVHSRVNEIKSLRRLGEIQEGDSTEPRRAGEIEIPTFTSYRLSTTVRVPKQNVVLVGGMTFDRTSEQASNELYLFVKVSVHDIVLDE